MERQEKRKTIEQHPEQHYDPAGSHFHKENGVKGCREQISSSGPKQSGKRALFYRGNIQRYGSGHENRKKPCQQINQQYGTGGPFGVAIPK